VTIQNFKISARISECTEIGRRISKTMCQRWHLIRTVQNGYSPDYIWTQRGNFIHI
jgi:hypothetical protein